MGGSASRNCIASPGRTQQKCVEFHLHHRCPRRFGLGFSGQLFAGTPREIGTNQGDWFGKTVNFLTKWDLFKICPTSFLRIEGYFPSNHPKKIGSTPPFNKKLMSLVKNFQKSLKLAFSFFGTNGHPSIFAGRFKVRFFWLAFGWSHFPPL